VPYVCEHFAHSPRISAGMHHVGIFCSTWSVASAQTALHYTAGCLRLVDAYCHTSVYMYSARMYLAGCLFESISHNYTGYLFPALLCMYNDDFGYREAHVKFVNDTSASTNCTFVENHTHGYAVRPSHPASCKLGARVRMSFLSSGTCTGTWPHNVGSN
jgi:hypothetical protein